MNVGAFASRETGAPHFNWKNCIPLTLSMAKSCSLLYRMLIRACTPIAQTVIRFGDAGFIVGGGD